jgi:hypothetical protein
VTSIAGAKFSNERNPENSCSIAAAENSEGVPPPMNIESMPNPARDL